MRPKIIELIKKQKWLYNPLHTCWIILNQIPVRTSGFFRRHGLFLNDNYIQLKKYKNLHKGERCFLVANGPSLTTEDLNKLKNEHTFACNKIYYLFGQTEWRPTYYCVLDEDYIKRYQDEIFAIIDMPIFTNNIIAKKIIEKNRQNKKILYSQQIIYNTFKAWPDLMSYTYATKQGSIMSFVMALALYMGFEEIYIIGMDNTSTVAGNHFAGYVEDKALEQKLRKRIKENGWNSEHWKNQTEFEMLQFDKYVKIHDINVYNATRGGKMDIFPRVNLDELIK